MKYLVILFFSALAVSCNNSDEQATANSDVTADSSNAMQPAAPAFASIEWIDSMHQDLGTIKKGQSVDITWKLRNNGTVPLVIENVAAGCGCTVAEKPEAPIQPGGEGIIKGRFDSQTQSAGEQRKNITVQANTEQKSYTLTFRAEVKE